MRVSGAQGLGTKASPCSPASGVWPCEGGRRTAPPLRDPSFLVSVPFSQQRIMQKRWQRKGRWGEKGGRLEAGSGEWGSTGPVRKEPPRSPPCRAESWGPGEGAGWPSRSALRPRPPSASPGRECLVPAAPSQGQRAGRAGRRLPSPPRPGASRAGAAAAAAPDSRRPRAGGARGVGQGEGLGSPVGELAPPGGRPCTGGRRAPPPLPRRRGPCSLDPEPAGQAEERVRGSGRRRIPFLPLGSSAPHLYIASSVCLVEI